MIRIIHQNFNCKHKHLKISFPFESISCVARTATTTTKDPLTKTNDPFEIKIIKSDTVKAYLTKDREISWKQEMQTNCPLYKTLVLCLVFYISFCFF